jgi:hypothetical protein
VLKARFEFCQIDPRNYFNVRPRDLENNEIFVTRASLDTLLAKVRSVPVAHIEADVYLSPYIRLMAEVSKVMDISPTAQSQTKIIQDEIRKRGKHIPRLSDHQIRVMATFIRDPASHVGGSKSQKR